MMPFFALKRISFIAAFFVIFALGIPGYAFAGTIVSSQKYSQFLNVDRNRDGTGDLINWIPNSTSVVITDTDVSGYIWGESVGWINLDPTEAPGGGVKNTCDGILSGYGWGQETGFVNFQTTDATIDPNIDVSTGEITGQVWSQNYGWIELASPDATYPGLETDWRPGPDCNECDPNTEDCCTGNCTNPIRPRVKIIKHVINNNATNPGTKQANDFILTLKLNGDLIGSNPGDEQGTIYTYQDGIVGGRIYQLRETQYLGYAASFEGDCDAQGLINVPKGFTGVKTCTIVNNDIPTNEVYDCTDPESPNYNPNATVDDGSCIIIDPPQPPKPPQPPQFPWTSPDPTKPVALFIGLDIILVLAFGRKRLRGIVYDATTKNPLDPVYVSVMNLDTGKEIASEITDIQGRFGFLLSKGRYKIISNKTHYKFPSELLKGKETDGIYDHLYFGEEFHVEKEEEVVIINIPMDPLEKDWNQQEKNRKSMFHYLASGQTRFGWISNFIFALGFFVAIVVTYYYPVLWNMIMVVIYIIVFIIQLTRYATPSFGVITKQGKPLVGARVKVFNKKLEKEIGHYMTTERGSYFLLVPPKNDYYIVVEEKDMKGVYTKVYTSKTSYTRKGIINKSFEIPWNNR